MVSTSLASFFRNVQHPSRPTSRPLQAQEVFASLPPTPHPTIEDPLRTPARVSSFTSSHPPSPPLLLPSLPPDMSSNATASSSSHQQQQQKVPSHHHQHQPSNGQASQPGSGGGGLVGAAGGQQANETRRTSRTLQGQPIVSNSFYLGLTYDELLCFLWDALGIC